MKINIGLELDDTQLRRLRASLGRGGAATRKEARIWINGLVRDALRVLPEPKARRRSSMMNGVHGNEDPSTRATYFTAMAAVADEAICGICRRPKSDHGKTAYTCPRVAGLSPGTRFSRGEVRRAAAQ